MLIGNYHIFIYTMQGKRQFAGKKVKPLIIHVNKYPFSDNDKSRCVHLRDFKAIIYFKTLIALQRKMFKYRLGM